MLIFVSSAGAALALTGAAIFLTVAERRRRALRRRIWQVSHVR